MSAPVDTPNSETVVSDLTDIDAVRAYLARIGAEPRSLTSAVVREAEGRYCRDIATIKFGKGDGTIEVRPGDEDTLAAYGPSEAEKAGIAEGFASAKWPELKPLCRLINMPPLMNKASADDRFEFREESGQIVMVQVRVERDGGKDYIPFTYWSDDRWRMCEPDGLLPLWGVDTLKDQATAFVHEGAKAARAMAWLTSATERDARERLKAHPWGDQLLGAAHVGWTGGALSAHRSDWAALAKAGIQRVYIVNDNDEPGRRAVPVISKALSRWNIEVINISVSSDIFPVGWDMADPMPTDDDGHFGGEPMLSYATPATYLTKKLPTEGRGRPPIVLRDIANRPIVPIRRLGCFAYHDSGKILQPDELDREQAPYADVKYPSGLFWKDNTHGAVAGLTYRPDQVATFVQEGDSRNFNVYRPSPIRAKEGGLGPWFEFLEFMFPDEGDRREVTRWIATLVGRPDIRLTYSLLLYSAVHGKGKSTLFDQVLRPLVGLKNSSPVTSKAMDSEFNAWAANRRLAVCHEIYEAGNWRLADRLKTVTTEERLTINEKYEKPFELPNWIVIAAASNDRRALALSRNDRRWLVPRVDEQLWPIAKFTEFRRWLATDGLPAMKWWAENFDGEYVAAGAHAPMTLAKREAIEESMSDGAVAAMACASRLSDWDSPGAVSLAGMKAKAQDAMPKFHAPNEELAELAKAEGLARFVDATGEDRVKIAGAKQRIHLNEAAVAALAEFRAEHGEALTEADRKAVAEGERKLVRRWLKAWEARDADRGADL